MKEAVRIYKHSKLTELAQRALLSESAAEARSLLGALLKLLPLP
jgi:hypothetical protein